MFTRTKIVATVGPASSEPGTVAALVEAGADVFRVNFSHGADEDRERFLATVREVEREAGVHLAVLADLCGPKVRVLPLEGGEAILTAGARVEIVRELSTGTAERIATTLPELIDALRPGEPVLLDDGAIRLEVESVEPPDRVTCRVLGGGLLRSGKGVNLPRTRLELSALTEKDRRDVRWIAERDFDYVALSFVRSARDVSELRSLLAEAGSALPIVAKIEKPEAVEAIEAIVAEADGIMVARGDLGVEMALHAVPVAQKRIARLCQRAGKPCIIATQMLESMVASATPTRAEVSDVANAVLDLADAVMLSAETAVGAYPVAAVRVMNETVAAIEAHHDETALPERLELVAAGPLASLAWAAREIAFDEQVAAVAVFTASGTVARVLAKSRLPCPILAMSADQGAMRRAALYYGVTPVRAAVPVHTREVLALASEHAVARGLAKAGDRLVVLSGRPIGVPGTTNTLVIHTVSG